MAIHLDLNAEADAGRAVSQAVGAVWALCTHGAASRGGTFPAPPARLGEARGLGVQPWVLADKCSPGRGVSCVDHWVCQGGHVIIATARTGEAIKDVIQHLFICFSYLGLPKALKTDNAPAYTSKSFQEFCIKFQIKHNTGIPYNLQGQAIVERAHQTLSLKFKN